MTGLKTLARASIDPFSLGNLVVGDGIVDSGELSELLSEFRQLNREELFGQFLVRKGVLSDEKLQLLLIRQSAVRSGGVQDKHVMQARELSDRTFRKAEKEVEDFFAEANKALSVGVKAGTK